MTPPVQAARLAGALPDLHELVMLRASGHMSPMESAQEVNAAVTRMVGAVAADTPNLAGTDRRLPTLQPLV